MPQADDSPDSSTGQDGFVPVIIESLRAGRHTAPLPGPRLKAWSPRRKAISETISADEVVIAWRRLKACRVATRRGGDLELVDVAEREFQWKLIAWLEGTDAAEWDKARR